MGKPGTSSRSRLLAWLEALKPAAVTEALWAELLELLAPVSARQLRRLLLSTGLPLAPLVAGVRQKDLDELERSLAELARVYGSASAAGDAARAAACRHAVIAAKDHARLAARNRRLSAETRARKEEMILWMLTWLENPELFANWVALRKKARGAPDQSAI